MGQALLSDISEHQPCRCLLLSLDSPYVCSLLFQILGLLDSIGVPIYFRQILKASCHAGIVWAKDLLLDGQTSLEERLGLGIVFLSCV